MNAIRKKKEKVISIQFYAKAIRKNVFNILFAGSYKHKFKAGTQK